MTRKLPHLGTAARNGTPSHDCHYCGQRLPQHMHNNNTDHTQLEQSKQAEQLVNPQREDTQTEKQQEDEVPDPDVTLPEASSSSSSSSQDEAPAAKKAAASTVPESPSLAPEMWLADCLSAIESKVGDFLTHFDHALVEPKSRDKAAMKNGEKSAATAAATAALPADPPSYDSAISPPGVKVPIVKNKAAPAKVEMKGLFHCSSKAMRLENGHMLHAQCADPKGVHHDSCIDLNDCLTNRAGSLKWKAGGNFKASAKNARLVDGQFLEVDIKDLKGRWKSDRICLSERISNKNGNLIFLKA